MSQQFPELTSFGTIFLFAQALEENTLALAEAAALRPDCAAWSGPLKKAARKHGKRGRELQRLRRERLNEVVLQPISGLARDEYLPPTELPENAVDAVATVAAADEVTARFYEAAAAMAANALGGMDRKFRKLAKESLALAGALRG